MEHKTDYFTNSKSKKNIRNYVKIRMNIETKIMGSNKCEAESYVM